MQLYSHIVGVAVGAMLAGWSATMLWLHLRASPETRRQHRVPIWIPCLLLVIGLADLFKALRDLLTH